MALKQFLQDLFERVGLAEPPAPPPRSADVPLADPQQLRPIVARLAAWGVKQVRFLVGDDPACDDLLQSVRQAVQCGMQAGIRGRASDLPPGLLRDLLAAGACEVEIPFLSAIGETHDALAGPGDYRCALRAFDALASDKPPFAAQIVVVPSTWKTIQRTLQLLDDRRVHEVRFFAVACRDSEPSNWAIAAGDLVAAARWVEQSGGSHFSFHWHPPRKFDPARTLAQQVRRGPRAAADAVRIEPDGGVILPVGPAVSAGNLFQDDWKAIARGELVRTWRRRRQAATRCAECPGLAACANGCLRDAADWSEQ